MTEITVRFNLTFSRRFLTTAATAAMMLCAVPELDSESVTLSTYYPAPSGVYTNMITTGHTYLARDPVTPVPGIYSFVGINTTALPVNGAGVYQPDVKLKVAGDVQVNHVTFPGVSGNSGVAANYYGIYQEAGAWSGTYPDLRVQYHTGISYDAYYNYGGHRFYTGYDGTGNPSGSGPVAAGGPTAQINDGVRAYVPIIYQGPACTEKDFGLGVTYCPGGQYATYTTGILVSKTFSAATTDPVGKMMCCPCPVSGCPNL